MSSSTGNDIVITKESVKSYHISSTDNNEIVIEKTQQPDMNTEITNINFNKYKINFFYAKKFKSLFIFIILVSYKIFSYFI
jgi:hypothetical protein